MLYGLTGLDTCTDCHVMLWVHSLAEQPPPWLVRFCGAGDGQHLRGCRTGRFALGVVNQYGRRFASGDRLLQVDRWFHAAKDLAHASGARGFPWHGKRSLPAFCVCNLSPGSSRALLSQPLVCFGESCAALLKLLTGVWGTVSQVYWYWLTLCSSHEMLMWWQSLPSSGEDEATVGCFGQAAPQQGAVSTQPKPPLDYVLGPASIAVRSFRTSLHAV